MNLEFEIVTIAERPELAPVVADWTYSEWAKRDGYSLEQTLEYISASGSPIPTTIVLLADGVPIGTSSLVAHDLDERPDFTPWLAGVFVAPEHRRKGYVIPLIQAVKAAAIAASVPTLWLHMDAKGIYARGGRQEVEVVARRGKPPVTLMRRDLMPGM